jgi:hypothetical protein
MHCCNLGKGISLPNQQRASSIFRRCGQVYLEGNPVEPSPKKTRMNVKHWAAPVVALACALVASGAAVALEDKAIEAGARGFAFKSRAFEIKEKGEVAVLLSFAAGRPVTVTTNGQKQTDVHLFIQDETTTRLARTSALDRIAR